MHHCEECQRHRLCVPSSRTHPPTAELAPPATELAPETPCETPEEATDATELAPDTPCETAELAELDVVRLLKHGTPERLTWQHHRYRSSRRMRQRRHR